MHRTYPSLGSKTRQQMAHEFNFSYPTFWRKLKEHGIDLPKGLICPKWQTIIYEKLGYPLPPGQAPEGQAPKGQAGVPPLQLA
jgi:hypothetical protein